VDCQERGLRESDWDDPLDSREEGVQKYSTSTAAANAKIAAMHTSTSASTSSVQALSKSTGGKSSAKSTSSISASSLIAKAASDFGTGKTASTKSNKNEAARPVAVDASQDLKKNDDELRKMILNAPRRITKIEGSLAKHEAEIKKIDDEMLTVRLLSFTLSSLPLSCHRAPHTVESSPIFNMLHYFNNIHFNNDLYLLRFSRRDGTEGNYMTCKRLKMAFKLK
jgi:hypothetical protein